VTSNGENGLQIKKWGPQEREAALHKEGRESKKLNGARPNALT